MSRYPIVLVHGYSSGARVFGVWQRVLESRGYDPTILHPCSYKSLTNEVTIKDIAEGFDRALRMRAGLDANEPFDAIVHSTGMLVVRAWLTGFPARRDRLKHLVALAPASFGSPLAHKGRSWMGALFMGSKHLGPDFLEAGDRVLDGLELGSSFTWDLAHQDLLGSETFYGPTRKTPYVFTFCGVEAFSGLRSLADEAGTDGTVRWAGCPLNSRKIVFDLTHDPSGATGAERVRVARWTNVDIPFIPIPGKNHSTIVSDPGTLLTTLVVDALQVSSAVQFQNWVERARKQTGPTRKSLQRWQQFVIRAVDERGDPVPDYNVQLFTVTARGKTREVRQFDMDVHTYRRDSSFRCFHVNLDALGFDRLENLWLRVMASSGSQIVGYHGYGSAYSDNPDRAQPGFGKWDAEIDISSLVDNRGVEFFFPFTTTLVELRLNREPLPIEGVNQVCWF